MYDDTKQALVEAVFKAGGQTNLAAIAGVRQGTISKYLNNKNYMISPVAAKKIEKATGISKSRLRPDVFDPELI